MLYLRYFSNYVSMSDSKYLVARQSQNIYVQKFSFYKYRATFEYKM